MTNTQIKMGRMNVCFKTNNLVLKNKCRLYPAYLDVQNSDIGAAPTYQTPQRARVVDFSEHFMGVQATLLLRKSYGWRVAAVERVEQLLNQTSLQYGTLDRGVIVRAFRTTRQRHMKTLWRRMVWNREGVLTETNREGIEKVRRENYAFILPSTIGDYVSLQPPCDLVTVGRFLMDRGYSLMVRRGFTDVPLESINEGLRALRDGGITARLYRRWWYDESVCDGGPSARGYRQTGSGHPRTHHTLSLTLLWAVCLIAMAAVPLVP